ncbi:SRPBCC family protein [Natronoglycomyces albus]|uniref:SRPBCC domain-containing protein n=1 Tax=Natronoglycomyces albus TaxID=2811108 RepID=A0A895XKF0_9ACTN|nr:SRPBCC domain-containing protein [Natronoglycomyces albus]QSB05527.1 SRPBCC domain-containing protein [Natronoglycomyces albus]
MNTSTPEFTISRTLHAHRDQVWRAWTTEKELAGWLPSTPLETIAFDVREGGHYRYTMINSETGEEYPTGGVFLEVVPCERLVFTWGNPQDPVESSPVITLTLAEDGDRTEMTFHMRGFAGHPGDGYVYDGWVDALADLAKHVGD